MLVEPPTWVANISRRFTELHWIMDYKHTIINIMWREIYSLTANGSGFFNEP